KVVRLFWENLRKADSLKRGSPPHQEGTSFTFPLSPLPCLSVNAFGSHHLALIVETSDTGDVEGLFDCGDIAGLVVVTMAVQELGLRVVNHLSRNCASACPDCYCRRVLTHVRHGALDVSFISRAFLFTLLTFFLRGEIH